jgi:hypothetical protein
MAGWGLQGRDQSPWQLFHPAVRPTRSVGAPQPPPRPLRLASSHAGRVAPPLRGGRGPPTHQQCLIRGC